VTKEMYESARDFYGHLWNYTGDWFAYKTYSIMKEIIFWGGIIMIRNLEIVLFGISILVAISIMVEIKVQEKMKIMRIKRQERFYQWCLLRQRRGY